MSTFTIPLTRQQFEAARAKLAAQGVTLTGDSGEVEGHKVGMAFSYDGSSVLTLTVEHKPWIYPESEVEKQIRGWFAEG